MDFKNFIDVLATPKNIGTNKWVLNNFSDLKSSNDYLHIIRLRYDNRWLRTYWDGKLKEVEKDFNFYVSTPIKSKLFFQNNTSNIGIDLLTTNSNIVSQSDGLKYKSINDSSKFYNTYERKYKDNLGEGNVKTNLTYRKFNNLYFSNYSNYDLESVYSEYITTRKYFQKNVKNNVKSFSELECTSNLWSLNRANNVSSVYPNYSNILLAGNLLLANKENDGDFNTNLMAIRDPSWSGLDRYFLGISRRNIQDLFKLNKFVEESFFSKNFKRNFTNDLFFQYSDHSDMNRWLKRG
jgi:hypothetical protein